jgi:NADH-quinone oxidoreductase subunit F
MESPLTQLIDPGRMPLQLDEYRARGGYESVRKALKTDPGEITRTVRESNLKGRGGAGFNTGMKWGFVPLGEEAPADKYFIVNADEMEPGTFKDRYLMEGNPHQLIEGIIDSAYAIQANHAYIFLRWAYKKSEKRLAEAIAETYRAGLLGKNILGSGYSLELHLHTSAGRYMCGEETGLLNAIEGHRAIPRAKPPFPQTSGAFGKPTIVNNVETVCCVPHIINNGAEWFNDLGIGEDGGTKLYGMSGHVNRPGLWELPIGTTMREILEDHAGGMKEGYRFRGALPGGASTEFLTDEHLDVHLDFTETQKAGSRLGTGTIVVLDDRTCTVGLLHNMMHFFAQESCGWCTPCREGLPWTEKTLLALEEGRGREEDIEILRFHTRNLGPGLTFCALAPGAMEPLRSALKYFHDDFETHIREQKCPYR